MFIYPLNVYTEYVNALCTWSCNTQLVIPGLFNVLVYHFLVCLMYWYITQLNAMIYIANSSWHWGSYGSIWTGLSPKKYYMDQSFWGPYNFFFGDGPVHILWPEVTWTICSIILLSKIIMQVPFRNRIENEEVQSRSI